MFPITYSSAAATSNMTPQDPMSLDPFSFASGFHIDPNFGRQPAPQAVLQHPPIPVARQTAMTIPEPTMSPKHQSDADGILHHLFAMPNPPAPVKPPVPGNEPVPAGACFTRPYRKAEKGAWLVEGHHKYGLTYAQLARLIEEQREDETDTCNESTLRGICRTAFKSAAERPRKPQWTLRQIMILDIGVQLQIRQKRLVIDQSVHGWWKKIKWAEVSGFIKLYTGFEFGNATCCRTYMRCLQHGWIDPFPRGV